MVKQRSVKTAYDICNAILKYGPDWKNGKKALQKHIAEQPELGIATPQSVRDYLQTIKAVLGGKGEAKKTHAYGDENLFTALSKDKEFKKLAKRALGQYELLNTVNRAHTICRLIIEYGPGWAVGKEKLQEHIATELKMSTGNLKQYIQTINAVLGRAKKPAKQHPQLYKNLRKDKGFKELATKAMDQHEAVGRIRTAHKICELIVRHGKQCKRGKISLQSYIAKQLDMSEPTIMAYMQTINAVITEGKEPSEKQKKGKVSIYDGLCADPEFKPLAKEAMSIYGRIDLVQRPAVKKPFCPLCGGFLKRNVVGKWSHKCRKCGYEVDVKTPKK
jgi:hypothetical protein